MRFGGEFNNFVIATNPQQLWQENKTNPRNGKEGLQRVWGDLCHPQKGTGVGSGPHSILAASPEEQEALSASALPWAFFITQLVVRPGAGGNVGFAKKKKKNK